MITPVENALPEAGAWLEGQAGERTPVVGSVSIGRSTSNQLALNSEKVSRRHALVHAQESGQYWVVDLGSRNGTLLNGRRLTHPVQLRDGDMIEICGFHIRFRQRDAGGLMGQSVAGETMHELRVAPCWLLLGDLEGSTEFVSSRPPGEVAVITGQWLAECKVIVEKEGGSINKFLGDGFFAYWRESPQIAKAVVRALQSLKELQAARQPSFRLVLHYGEVCSGGGASLGEESLSGPEVNFIFRIEKLASPFGVSRLASQAAAERLAELMSVCDKGEGSVPSFAGNFRFFTF